MCEREGRPTSLLAQVQDRRAAYSSWPAAREHAAPLTAAAEFCSEDERRGCVE